MKRLYLPVLENERLSELRAGDTLLLCGALYTGRDAAHKRMCALLDTGCPLPFEPNGQAIYYVGPCPAPPGRVIGACGPTTSGRMDAYAPRLMAEGLRIMIGKGQRSAAVLQAMRAHGGVYLAACGGAGAYLAQCVKSARVVAFEDLGAEAVYRLEVADFPVTVAADAHGGDLFAR